MEPTPVGNLEDTETVASQFILLATCDNYKDSKILSIDIYAEPTISVKSASDHIMSILNDSELLSDKNINTTVSPIGGHIGRHFTISVTPK
ncbi:MULTISPECIES: hypothetical protein [unclassified Tatumella]|uniref:hypothetical protein n=1 Tax=unclassified Tatumella TaxID=2649542 RepID=UPI001BAF50E7|nr:MULTISPECIES: hypothetical protein [unclassified Tatumella]MBS0856712.1 hypothetical protein [Tatumella sp. JGM16]